ncbi:venom metalloproteinase BumaMPs1-like [Rhipicephalus microplus]|uniref:venom metalloproteinase BumaMPs1-like n=1 Tax=Rhipicephalus microplus TaxID=6941 RepID=UPI003F6A8F93
MLILMFPSYVSILVFGIARVTLFVKLSLAYPITSHPGSSNEKSAIVYPQVYENRQDNSEKILVIDGYSLNLNKASVLADTVLLLDVTANGTAEQYVQGPHYERHLFEDKEKLASLILKPLGGGSYHITGMVNYTHRIEPGETWERSSQERLAHRLSLIDVTPGTYDVVNNVDNSFKNEQRYQKIKNRALPKFYTVETHFITGLKHTSYFGNGTEDRVAYAMLFMHAVSLRLQQLEPPARIGLTTIEGLKETPPYINLHQDGRVMIYQTLAALGKHANNSKVHKLADVVYLAVSAGLVKIKNGTNQGSTLGMANMARACMFGKVAIGFDRPATFSGVQTTAHEIAHLLNADHDGYRTAKDCSGKDGYIMSSPRKHGKNSCAFSSCSKKDIASFLT